MAEDGRIALASLAVAAVVGVGAPFATVIATNQHDSDRLHQEQVQSDRAELRRVLDDAAASLYVANTRFQRFTRADVIHHPLVIRHQVDGLAERYNRVAIRLGRQAPAAQAMKGALTAASAVDTTVRALNAHFVFGGSPDDRRAARLSSGYGEAIARYGRLVDDFVDAANRVARSTT